MLWGIRQKLKALTSSELKALAEEVLDPSDAVFHSEAALVDALMEKRREVGKALGLSDNWFLTHNVHIYGAVSVIGVLLAAATLVLPPPNGRDQPLSPSERQTIVAQIMRWRSQVPLILSEPGRRENLAAVPAPSFEGFKLIQSTVVMDLTRWEPVASVDRNEFKSPVVRRVRQLVEKTADENHYRVLTSTSGLDVFTRSLTGQRLTEYASDERFQFGRYITKPRLLEFDVSEVPIEGEFLLRYESTYWNAFESDDQSWVAFGPNIETDIIECIVLFPDKRPFTSYRLTATDANGDSIALSEQVYVMSDPEHKWIWWRVTDPLPNFAYNVDWDW